MEHGTIIEQNFYMLTEINFIYELIKLDCGNFKVHMVIIRATL